jgi:hypothetical protein
MQIFTPGLQATVCKIQGVALLAAWEFMTEWPMQRAQR